jgi:hypothetical protein
MQYHQVGILCALRDKIVENGTSLTGHQFMDRARARMTRLIDSVTCAAIGGTPGLHVGPVGCLAD